MKRLIMCNLALVGILAGPCITKAENLTQALPAGHPSVAGSHGGSTPDRKPAVTGEIVETMDTGNYTYIKVQGADQTIWAATERYPAKVGDRVTVPGEMVMKNFQSPTLGRTFDEIYFTERVLKEGEDVETALPAGHPAVTSTTESAPETAPTLITQPEGGTTVADLYAKGAELAGQEVVVKGKVTSYTERVMGRNWIHLADGTGTGRNKELVFNSTATTQVGAIITVRGVVSVNEDLGHGYQYAVLIKDASITAE